MDGSRLRDNLDTERGSMDDAVYDVRTVGTEGHGRATRVAQLEQPVYQMAYDLNGQLWATTGGGGLLQRVASDAGLCSGS